MENTLKRENIIMLTGQTWIEEKGNISNIFKYGGGGVEACKEKRGDG